MAKQQWNETEIALDKVITDYKCDVEAITKYKSSGAFHIGIELGGCEGYYVTVRDGYGTEYALRTHSYNEAAKTLGCMLTLLPRGSNA